MFQRLPRTTPLATALFAGLFCATGASAAPTVGAATTAEAPIGTAGTTTPSSSSGFASSGSSANDTAGNAGSFAFSSATGAYAVSSNAEGNAQATAAATFSQTIANNTGTAQHYFLTMKIYGGNVGLNVADPAGLVGGESLKSYYQALVTADNIQKFYSFTQVEKDSSNLAQCTHAGVVLTGAGSCGAGDGFYSWQTDFYTIDLGVVDAGDDVTIYAELAGASITNVGTYDFGSTNTGYGYGCFTEIPVDTLNQAFTSFVAAAPSECIGFKGSANQFYGDPGLVNGNPIDDNPIFGIRQVSVIPSPATPLLVGLGLGAIGWVGHRRRKSAESADTEAPPTR